MSSAETAESSNSHHRSKIFRRKGRKRMTATGEPAVKKSRRTRILELDLSQFPDWVSTATESTLLEVFAVGVKVKDLITINITENPKYFKEVLCENLQPVYKEVKEMSKQFGTMQNNVARNVASTLNDMRVDEKHFQDRLVSNVQGVAAKVPALDSLNSKIDNAVAPLNRDLTKLVSLYQKPATKGALGELQVQTILKQHFCTYTIKNVGGQGRKGDIHIKSSQSGQKYLVEVKDRENTVPAKEIVKFEKNVRENKDFKVGILFSLRSGIAVRAKHGRFKVEFKDGQYLIYVPNALNDGKDLIVWIVALADQLAALDRGLTDSQTQAVADLLQEFRESMEKSKNCKTHLDALKRTVEELEKSIEPLLKIIDQAKRKLNKVLHQERKSGTTKKVPKTQRKIIDFLPNESLPKK